MKKVEQDRVPKLLKDPEVNKRFIVRHNLMTVLKGLSSSDIRELRTR